MFSPTTAKEDQLKHPKHHIDIEKDTAQLLKFLKKRRSDTYDEVIKYLIKQTKDHQKCLSKNKMENKK